MPPRPRALLPTPGSLHLRHPNCNQEAGLRSSATRDRTMRPTLFRLAPLAMTFVLPAAAQQRPQQQQQQRPAQQQQQQRQQNVFPQPLFRQQGVSKQLNLSRDQTQRLDALTTRL